MPLWVAPGGAKLGFDFDAGLAFDQINDALEQSGSIRTCSTRGVGSRQRTQCFRSPLARQSTGESRTQLGNAPRDGVGRNYELVIAWITQGRRHHGTRMQRLVAQRGGYVGQNPECGNPNDGMRRLGRGKQRCHSLSRITRSRDDFASPRKHVELLHVRITGKRTFQRHERGLRVVQHLDGERSDGDGNACPARTVDKSHFKTLSLVWIRLNQIVHRVPKERDRRNGRTCYSGSKKCVHSVLGALRALARDTRGKYQPGSANVGSVRTGGGQLDRTSGLRTISCTLRSSCEQLEG